MQAVKGVVMTGVHFRTRVCGINDNLNMLWFPSFLMGITSCTQVCLTCTL